MCSWKFAKFKENICAKIAFLLKMQASSQVFLKSESSWKPATFLRKRIWHRCEHKWWFARFGTICTILKSWKTPIEKCYIQQSCRFLLVTLLKITLVHGCFLRFLNCTNGTKSCKASHMSKCHLLFSKNEERSIQINEENMKNSIVINFLECLLLINWSLIFISSYYAKQLIEK